MLDSYEQERKPVHEWIMDEAEANHSVLAKELFQAGIEEDVGRAVVTVTDDQVLGPRPARFESGERARGAEVTVLLVEAGRIDVAFGDPAPDVVEGALEVEAKRAASRFDRVME